METKLSETHSELKNLTAALRDKLKSLSEQVQTFKESSEEVENGFNVQNQAQFEISAVNYGELSLISKNASTKSIAIIGDSKLAFQIAELASRASCHRIVFFETEVDSKVPSFIEFLTKNFPTVLFESHSVEQVNDFLASYDAMLCINASISNISLQISKQALCLTETGVWKSDSLVLPPRNPDPLMVSVVFGTLLSLSKTNLEKMSSIEFNPEDSSLKVNYTEAVEENISVGEAPAIETPVYRPEDVSSMNVQAESVKEELMSPTPFSNVTFDREPPAEITFSQDAEPIITDNAQEDSFLAGENDEPLEVQENAPEQQPQVKQEEDISVFQEPAAVEQELQEDEDEIEFSDNDDGFGAAPPAENQDLFSKPPEEQQVEEEQEEDDLDLGESDDFLDETGQDDWTAGQQQPEAQNADEQYWNQQQQHEDWNTGEAQQQNEWQQQPADELNWKQPSAGDQPLTGGEGNQEQYPPQEQDPFYTQGQGNYYAEQQAYGEYYQEPAQNEETNPVPPQQMQQSHIPPPPGQQQQQGDFQYQQPMGDNSYGIDL